VHFQHQILELLTRENFAATNGYSFRRVAAPITGVIFPRRAASMPGYHWAHDHNEPGAGAKTLLNEFVKPLAGEKRARPRCNSSPAGGAVAPPAPPPHIELKFPPAEINLAVAVACPAWGQFYTTSYKPYGGSLAIGTR
jgi:hypothetical protein